MSSVDYNNPVYDAPVDNSVDGIVTAQIMTGYGHDEKVIDIDIHYQGYRGPGYVQLIVTDPGITAPTPYLNEDIESALIDEFPGEEVRFDYAE